MQWIAYAQKIKYAYALVKHGHASYSSNTG